jgi:hypothetical protein
MPHPRRAATRVVVALVILLATTCTSNQGATPPTTSSTAGATDVATPPPPSTLVDGRPLPADCQRVQPTPGQTVTFVADRRAWALDPHDGTLTCLFGARDPGPFAWGPQADRVMLAGLATRGLGAEAPTLDAAGETPAVFDWGHPIGLAIVYAEPEAKKPFKRFVDDGRVERLGDMRAGTYLDIAYHPSGLALGSISDDGGDETIWLSSNEGEDPTSLVFSRGGTRFTSIAFSPDGEQLWWTALHAGGFAQIHSMDLDDRSGFDDVWTGPAGSEAWNLQLPPSGPLMAFDSAAGCEGGRATIVYGPRVQRPALRNHPEPSTALGWLDRHTLLVAAGECGEPLDLFAVDALGSGQPALLASGVDVAAPRVVAPVTPSEVPAPPSEEPPPEGGVG